MTEPVEPSEDKACIEWIRHRESVWLGVRHNLSIFGFVEPCYMQAGECVVHISSSGRRRCVVCRTELLGPLDEGSYVDYDAAMAALAIAVKSVPGSRCHFWPGGKCSLTRNGHESMTCKRCGSLWEYDSRKINFVEIVTPEAGKDI